MDESAVTGESAPVIRESGGDRSAVTGGTRVLSDWLVIRITANPGETFIDRMIALVEGASRQKTPNEIALTILLSGLTIVFLLAVVTLQPFAIYSGGAVAPCRCWSRSSSASSRPPSAACSRPSASPGMDRLIQHNVIAMSGRAVEAAGDVNTLLLDKTGTITLGNRQAVRVPPASAASRVEELADAGPARLAARRDARGPQHRGAGQGALSACAAAPRGDDGQAPMTFVPVLRRDPHERGRTSASGSSARARPTRSRAGSARRGGACPPETDAVVRVHRPAGRDAAGRRGAGERRLRVLGVVHLKDVVKGGMKERFDRLRTMGIRTVMITGDNPLTAAAIAAEAGVDDFLAEATPEQKLELIRKEQAGGRLVAMTGDGTNDAPALAQADVGVAMNTGTQAAREAGNMVDLDSNPTKLIEIVEIGKQLLMTAGLAHHVLHRQRRGQVLRDHPGDVRGDLSRARRAQRHAAAVARVGHPEQRHLQCAHHHRAHPAGAARRHLPARAGGVDPAAQPASTASAAWWCRSRASS